MPLATGIAKQLRYKVEATWGTAPGTGSAQLLRRVSSDLDLKKETYESQELLTHYQRQDYRHGVRSVGGSIRGELSPGTYKEFMQATLRRDFVAVSTSTGLTLTIATSGIGYSITRSTGSFWGEGKQVGDVVRITTGTFNAANMNKNLLVIGSTSTAHLLVVPLNGVAMVAEGPFTSGAVAVPGKKTFVPTTGHTDRSYAIEHYYSDVSLSELFLGCKVDQVTLDLPPSGIATIDMQFMGKDVTTATAEYYVSPTAETSAGLLAAVNGVITVGTAQIALITGVQLTFKGNMSGEPVVGSNTYPDIFEGREIIEGQMTALFQDATLRDYFINETEVSIAFALTTNSNGTADFIGISLPRVKAGGAAKSDGEKAIVQTIPFVALRNSLGGTGNATEISTIVIQDSLA